MLRILLYSTQQTKSRIYMGSWPRNKRSNVCPVPPSTNNILPKVGYRHVYNCELMDPVFFWYCLELCSVVMSYNELQTAIDKVRERCAACRAPVFLPKNAAPRFHRLATVV
ncbi:hypothetical protein Y032_0011g1576 [Ancylostoma ceylanicum]|uniref:Uncharacterized protein n=1 Tax=Ancylostoma ceylanicum TaxID=53326 RepID=A0A016VFS3_9BILA|nr:hypothetical protein Y032_0011g1576 [Ancylostoma ceylanicum]